MRPVSADYLVLTAAVQPAPGIQVALKSYGERLLQYQHSVNFWARTLAGTGVRLVVAESTGYDLEELTALADDDTRHEIMLVPVTPTPDLVTRGKGAIESFMLDRVFDEFDTSCGTMYKVTGRLRLANVRDCIRSLPPQTVAIRGLIDRSYADTRMFAVTGDVWPELFYEMWKQVDDRRGVYLEHIIAGRIALGVATGALAATRFPRRPRFRGVSGTSGRRYGFHWSQLVSAAAEPLETMMAKVAAKKQV